MTILLIEGFILYADAQRLRADRLSEIEDRGSTWLTTILRVHGNVMDEASIAAAATELPGLSLIKGITLFRPDGQPIGGFGEQPSDLTPSSVRATLGRPGHLSADLDTYRVTWGPPQIGAPYIAVALIDSRSVQQSLIAALLRKGGLALGLSLIVTAATMLVLGVIVLLPIMHLRTKIQAAGHDPTNPEAHLITDLQKDELGEVATAFNGMVRRLAQGINRVRDQEAALRSANDELEERVQRRTKDLSEAIKMIRREAADRELAEAEASRLSQLPDTNPDPVFHVSRSGEINYANPASQQLLSYWGVSLGDKIPEKLNDVFGDVRRRGKQSQIEVTAVNDLFELLLRPTDDGDIHVFGKDITENRKAEDRIHHLANHDLLTGLPNRSLLKDRLGLILDQNQRGRRLGAIHVINFDGFKEINNSLGINVGDALLQETSEILRSCVRSSDTVARLSGDEFVVIQADAKDAHQAATLAQKISDQLSTPLVAVGHRLHPSVSIGITLFPDDGASVDQLLQNADLALERAKAEGGAQYCFFVNEMNDSIQHRIAIERDLRVALEKEQFAIHYQPKFTLLDNSVRGTEALMRWNHPERGFLSPAEFIPIAEMSRQIIPMGEWVLRTACNQAQRWLRDDLSDAKIAVNLSAVQFGAPGLASLVEQCLAESGLAANRLELEITETVVMNDVDNTASVLAQLSDLGVGLSIDDFGTGYSSLNYLEKFPVDRIKIDKSFVDGIGSGTSAEAITNAVITMGHSLGLQVTAEGVERHDQVQYLRKNNCDEIQGFYFSRPLEAKAFEELVSNGGRSK